MDAPTCVDFWERDQLKTIKPRSLRFGEQPEGWDVHEFLRRTLGPYLGQNQVTEIGCGYGRLCEAFDAGAYLGLDINRHAIAEARELHPRYRFETIEFAGTYPPTYLRLLYTVLLHVPDELIADVVGNLCTDTTYVVVAESLGRHGRQPSTTPVFLRDRADYEALFDACGFVLEEEVRRPYHYYPGWDLSLTIMRRRRAAPTRLSHFPDDLGDADLRYAGIYDDGWLDRAVRVTLTRAAARVLRVQGTVPLLNEDGFTTTCTVDVGGVLQRDYRLSVGDFEVTIDLAEGGELESSDTVVTLTFSSDQRLPPPDDRSVTALLRSIAFE
jgi:SAM-dependent methyltransferase